MSSVTLSNEHQWSLKLEIGGKDYVVLSSGGQQEIAKEGYLKFASLILHAAQSLVEAQVDFGRTTDHRQLENHYI